MRWSEWVTDLVREAHGDMLPEDWRYETIREALDRIANDGPDVADDEDEVIEDMGTDFADDVDIYTAELTGWLHSRADRYSYVDAFVEEYDYVGEDPQMAGTSRPSVLAMIRGGQMMERREVWDSVIKSLRAQIEHDRSR